MQGTAYDAMSHRTASWRLDTDGATNQLHRMGYDLDGNINMIAEVNALNAVTLIFRNTNSIGNLVITNITNTFADTGIRVETYYITAMKLLRHIITIVCTVATFIANAGEQLTAKAKGAVNQPTAAELQLLQGTARPG